MHGFSICWWAHKKFLSHRVKNSSTQLEVHAFAGRHDTNKKHDNSDMDQRSRLTACAKGRLHGWLHVSTPVPASTAAEQCGKVIYT
eukprot:COSAG01_NODE_2820_length_7012_cov_5.502965_4_plen_86_part_00